MAKFSVGEVAILTNVFHPTYAVMSGSEVTILKLPAPRMTRHVDDNLFRIEETYVIEVPGYGKFAADENQLRKKRPPEETTSWDKCVWNPLKQPEVL